MMILTVVKGEIDKKQTVKKNDQVASFEIFKTLKVEEG